MFFIKIWEIVKFVQKFQQVYLLKTLAWQTYAELQT